jgi:toxin ParE1/3/4
VVPKVIWSPQSRDDLGNIAREIAQDRPGMAATYCFALMDKVEALAPFPFSGRKFPRQDSPHLREFIVPPYRIIYELRPEAGALDVLRVWDARRGEPEFVRPISP